MYEKDEYSYYGLIELYFEWAKKVKDNQERVDDITKAEEVIISQGMKKIKYCEGLWIISSNIQEYLGDPGYLEALEKAVKDNPSSIYARYCLGHTYRKLGQVDKSKETLYPIIKNHIENIELLLNRFGSN